MTPLADLFPEGVFRFHFTLRRGEPREFFRPHDPTGRLVAERARWLGTEPGRYAALTPEGGPLFAKFAALCGEWELGRGSSTVALGAELEPDFLLLSPDERGEFRLRGGALCFPSGWALEEKIGHTLDFIHGVVPGLNAALAAPIRQFLTRLKPGVAFLRDNWGIAANDELNRHPARGMEPPARPVELNRLWLRVEHQALVALPQSGGVVFGIRIALHRLDRVAADAAAADGLRQALASMPPEVAVYKRLEDVRDDLLRALSRSG